MGRTCVLLGAGRAARDVAQVIKSISWDVDIACWRSAAQSYDGITTVGWTATIKNLDTFSERFLALGIKKVCLIGRIPDQDVRQPSDRESIKALMSDGATLPRILRRLERKMKSNGLVFANLSREHAEFSVDHLISRGANASERAWFGKVRGAADLAPGIRVPDSAVLIDNCNLVPELEDGVDALLERVEKINLNCNQPVVLIKSCPSGLGALLPSVIGPQTIKKAVSAGVKSILLDATSTILVERDDFTAALSASGIELVAA